MVRIIPQRLKSHNGSQSTSRAASRGPSPMRGGAQTLVLRTTVVKGRNLAPKDKGNTSDPYLVVVLGDARQSTPTISKTLNPEWNTTFDLPIMGPQSLLLEATCWDRDRFGKDYMGSLDVIVEDIFAAGTTTPEPQWHTLESRRSGRKKKKSSVVSGEILLKFEMVDTAHKSSTPQDILHKFMAITADPTNGTEDVFEEDNRLTPQGSLQSLDDDDEDEEGETEVPSSDEVDAAAAPEVAEKRKRKLRLKRLRRKTKAMAYEFGGSDCVGIVYLEIGKITDLPPERNVTRTSFDMDPFVVASLGRKTYRTRIIRHNLNPVYNEKMIFQVAKHEQQYSMHFSVVDRDKLSGNDFVGTCDMPLSKVIDASPEADPETGLFKIRETPESPLLTPNPSKPKFRLPLSRTTSSQSLNKLSRPGMAPRQSSATGQFLTLSPPADTSAQPNAVSTATTDPLVMAPITSHSSIDDQAPPPQPTDDPDFRPYLLPIDLKHKDKWNDKHPTQLHVRAKYLPYPALIQQFWRAMLKSYDVDDSGKISKVELTTMLDTLGSTLKESTIDGFFKRFPHHNGNDDLHELTIDQAVICLEDELKRHNKKPSLIGDAANRLMKRVDSHLSSNAGESESDQYHPGDPTAPSSPDAPSNQDPNITEVPVIKEDFIGEEGEAGALLGRVDLNDNSAEEHVIEIRECPICHQPRLNKRSDADIIAHIATCASQDWRNVNRVVMAGFVTSSQAQRKWYSKVINKVSYGGYKLGANSANILVQDRRTGQINEERMSVYVRLGIRLLYKGLQTRDMETKRIRKLLKSMSFKQGRKYDDPASAREIEGFINFHKLDMSEVLQQTSEFKNFNEFFYRKLKPEARPCSAPDDPRVIVSPADCRTVVFNKVDDATRVWIKGRHFSIKRLLGDAYPEDVSRFNGGALGIFRLAPQDYHRFHIPVDGIMREPKTIAGEYYTVNPMAIRSALDVYGENIRVVVPIDSVAHGRVQVVCVGAMMVGSTVITRKAGENVKRAEELGYFKFGGSTLIVLFEPGVMTFDEDLLDNSSQAVETLIRVGMSIGHSPEIPQYVPDMPKDQKNVTAEERQEAKRRIEGSLAPITDGMKNVP